MSLAELQMPAGSPGSTLRVRLRQLVEVGAIDLNGAAQSGNSCEYRLTPAGRELLAVAETLEQWLCDAPGGSRSLGGDRAKASISALAEAWSATLLRALAATPLSIAALDGLIAGLNYPSLERRIAAMRRTGQVEAHKAGGRETPYAVTDWLRRGVAPLLAAVRWEHRHARGATLARIDVETIFLLAMPLVTLGEERSGSCRLSVELPVRSNGHDRMAGALTEFADGKLSSCASRLDGRADAWCAGSVAAWLEALIDDDGAALEVGGNGRLAREVVGGLHRALFAATPRPSDAVPA